MLKILGALGAVSLGLLVVFYYLVGERQESKQEIRNDSVEIERESLLFDKEMAMSKYFFSDDKEGKAYYKGSAEAIDEKIAKIDKQVEDERIRLEEIRKKTEQFYKDTEQAVINANDKLGDEDQNESNSFYKKLRQSKVQEEVK